MIDAEHAVGGLRLKYNGFCKWNLFYLEGARPQVPSPRSWAFFCTKPSFFGVFCAFLFCFSLGFPAQLAAQDGPGSGQSIPIQNFEPLPGGTYNLTLNGSARTLGAWEWSVGAFANYAHQPLQLLITETEIADDGTRIESDPREEVFIQGILQTDLLAAVGFGGGFQLGLRLPIVPLILQDFDDGVDVPSIALSDVALYPLFQIVGGQQPGFGAAIMAPIYLPTGNQDAFTSQGGVTVAPRLLLDWLFQGGSRVVANAALILRPESEFVDNITVDDEFFFSTGYEYVFMPERFSAMIESQFRVPLRDFENEDARGVHQPAEWLLSGRYWPHPEHAITLGGGLGLGNGYGTPVFRVVLGYSYTQAPPPPSDRDGDELSDPVDQCPEIAEDLDGFEDSDGCPDYDNDQDAIADDVDACPFNPEDVDGFADEDGCPDLDNDGDGIPTERDKCPDEIEDFDGFEDQDGCPDPDNDVDGIPDTEDLCFTTKEVYNGVEDEDGCPDEGDAKVFFTKERIVIKEKIFFEYDKAVILPESYNILAQVSGVIKSNPQIDKVEIQGHTDDQGGEEYNMELSQRRAEAVRQFLIATGVSPQRLVARGYGKSQPLVRSTSERARAKNRRVEFLIINEPGEKNPK